jgi:hypothetical protein
LVNVSACSQVAVPTWAPVHAVFVAGKTWGKAKTADADAVTAAVAAKTAIIAKPNNLIRLMGDNAPLGRSV